MPYMSFVLVTFQYSEIISINPLQYDKKKSDDISIFRMMSNCLKILLQAVEGVRDVGGEAGDLQHKKDLL